MDMTRSEAASSIGSYTIVSLLGKGGMGEVYRARDSRLGREVAIKMLPDSFVADPERVARFDREARLLAALNHPNIATIHGLEEHDGKKVLILELVEGETLDERILRGSIPIDEALNLAAQITEGLETAHEKGVIHRDLKPANIKITPDGRVKLLDFGLAKAFAGSAAVADSAESPTLSIDATRQGVLLGTAPYMSPEQARGEDVDLRTDIWAFGCVLYEMLTGTSAFGRPTATESIARVLEGDVDFDRLPSATPALVVRLIRRCLEKNPRDRLQHIGDARFELADAATFKVPADAPANRSRRAFVGVAGIAAVSAAGGFFAGTRRRSVATGSGSATALLVPLPDGETHAERESNSIAISRDGSRVFFTTSDASGPFRVYSRAIDEPYSRLVIDSARRATPTSIFISPDGNWIGTGRLGYALRYPAARPGEPMLLGSQYSDVETSTQRIQETYGASWAEDDRILFGTDRSSGLWMNWVTSDRLPEQVSTLDAAAGERNHAWPHWLPNGNALFTVIRDGPIESAELAVLYPDGRHKRLGISGTQPRYSSTGHIVFGASGRLLAVRFDPNTNETLANPIPVVDDVRTTASGMAAFDLSDNGTLVYLTGGAEPAGTMLASINRDGTPRVMEELGRDEFLCVRASPTDNNLLAAQIRDAESGNEDIWLLDLTRPGTPTPIIEDSGINATPLFTRDGRSLVFSRSRSDDPEAPPELYRVPIEGGAEERLYVGENAQRLMAMGWGPERDDTLVFMQGGDAQDPDRPDADIRWLSMAEPSSNGLLRETPDDEGFGSTSADGNWVAFAGNQVDGWQIWLGRYADLGSRQPYRVSGAGGYYPLVSRDGTRIYYYGRDRRAIWYAPVTFAEETADPGVARLFFAGSPLPSAMPPRPYDETQNGSIVTILSGRALVEPTPPPDLIVEVGWSQRLTSLLPG